MQRGRLLILVGLLLLLVTGGAFILLSGMLNPAPVEPTPEGGFPTPTPQLTQIVIAVQPLPRGSVIPPEALALVPWPAEAVPETAILEVSLVVGKLARYDIGRGEPVLNTLIAEDARGLSATGSEAALKIPQQQVAISIPISRLSSVGYALKEGDSVNVLAAMQFVDVDETSQSALPNTASILLVDPVTNLPNFTQYGATGSANYTTAQDPLIPNSSIVSQPSEPQRPRLVVQQIVQNARVLQVGTFGESPDTAPATQAPPTPTPAPDTTAPTAVPPTPVPPPDMITLIVSPQDALVLNYFMYADAKLTLVLRSAGDQALVETESVTLQYAIERFRISVPTRLQFALEPSVRTLTSPSLPNDPFPVLIPLPDGTFICAGSSCP